MANLMRVVLKRATQFLWGLLREFLAMRREVNLVSFTKAQWGIEQQGVAHRPPEAGAGE